MIFVMPKIRLDEHLVENGYFESITVARGWIMSGKIVVGDTVVNKPGLAVSESAKILVRGLRLQYASKGGYKLQHALERFGVCVAGRICLDAGASTGGFTDCLLQAGASFVHSVEVGFGQLRGELVQNPKVRSLERTNISEVNRFDLNPPISLATADLSYLSLRKSIPTIMSLFNSDDHKIVFLIKPLYEGLKQIDKANFAKMRNVLSELLTDLRSQNIRVNEICVSPILGGRGAIEFLGYIDSKSRQERDEVELIPLAISEAERNPPLPIEHYLRGSQPTTRL